MLLKSILGIINVWVSPALNSRLLILTERFVISLSSGEDALLLISQDGAVEDSEFEIDQFNEGLLGKLGN